MAPKSLQRNLRKRGREKSESPPPAKRRTRASIKSSGEVIPDIFRPVVDDDEEEGEMKASGLRVRPKRRGRLGRLEAINDMPLELLYAILCFLTPLDLLHLARTSKDLRALLLSRRSSHVWVAARKSFSGIFDSTWDVHDNRAVVIPRPPVWMSEPSYANMLFTTECHVCQAPNSDALVEFVTQTRLCKACLDLGDVFSDDENASRCLKSDRDVQDDVPFIKLGKNRSFYRHVPSAVALLSETASMDDLDYIAWCNLKGEENTKRQKAASKCAKTYDKLSALWSQTRLESVMRRLEAKGWKNELKHQVSKDYLEAHNLIADAKGPFTEYGWRSTQSTLVQYMRVVKLRRVQQERVELFWEAYSKHAASLPDVPVLPPAATVGRSAELQELISNRNLDEALTVDDFLAVLDTHLGQIASKWRSSQEVALQKLLHQAKRETDLSFAVSVFECQKCQVPLWPNAVLAHSCFLNNAYYKDSGSFGVYNLKSAIVLRRSEDGMEMVRRALVRCEIDPKVTIVELDEQRVSFACQKCVESYPDDVIALNWRALFLPNRFSPYRSRRNAFCRHGHPPGDVLSMKSGCKKGRGRSQIRKN